jgi:hypothetical protein
MVTRALNTIEIKFDHAGLFEDVKRESALRAKNLVSDADKSIPYENIVVTDNESLEFGDIVSDCFFLISSAFKAHGLDAPDELNSTDSIYSAVSSGSSISHTLKIVDRGYVTNATLIHLDGLIKKYVRYWVTHEMQEEMNRNLFVNLEKQIVRLWTRIYKIIYYLTLEYLRPVKVQEALPEETYTVYMGQLPSMLELTPENIKGLDANTQLSSMPNTINYEVDSDSIFVFAYPIIWGVFGFKNKLNMPLSNTYMGTLNIPTQEEVDSGLPGIEYGIIRTDWEGEDIDNYSFYEINS